MTRTELIAALEKAEAGSRELDAEIAVFLSKDDDYTSIEQNFRGYDWCVRYYPGPPGPEYSRVPRYTTSLDAGLMLVPAGLDWCISVIEPGPYAVVGNNNSAYMANTPALALCVASLSARGET